MFAVFSASFLLSQHFLFSSSLPLLGTPFSRALQAGSDGQPGPRMLSTMAPVSRRVWRKFIFPRAIQRALRQEQKRLLSLGH